jgi:hypothetical protein
MILKYTPTKEQVEKFLKIIEERTKKNQHSSGLHMHKPRL